jgi:muconolactone D-isomerase
MLFLVHITVDGAAIDPGEQTSLVDDERKYSQQLQAAGKWLHLWRVAGQWASYSVFDCDSHEELHHLLAELPLFRYLDVTVTPLAEHPSRLAQAAGPGPAGMSGVHRAVRS